MARILCEYEKEIYFNETNGASVQSAYIKSCDDPSKKIINTNLVITGFHLPRFRNVEYEMDGSFVNHPTYGLQFKVENYKEFVAENKKSIISYLSSGAIKGIGDKTAEKIYAMFGNDTLKILDEDIGRLKNVKGISEAKLKIIKESYLETRNAQEVISFLKPYGVSAVLSLKLFKKYGQQLINILKEDIYKLCENKGIGFSTIERIARSKGYDLVNETRIKAAIIHVLRLNESSGHCGMSVDKLLKNLVYILGEPRINMEILNEVSADMIKKKEVIISKTMDPKVIYVYLPETYFTESRVARKLVELSSTMSSSYITLDMIKKVEKTQGLHLHINQEMGVYEAVNNRISIITGGPGTGKTATLNTIYRSFKTIYPEKEILLFSPTGKAARKMAESTGEYASTIHSGLQITDSREEEVPMEIDVLPADMIIVDEFSMVDIFLFDKLLSALSDTCQLVLIGDIDQLPSVGPGCVLKDLIESNICPVVRLTKIFRQKEDSLIIHNAHKIKNGEMPVFGKGFTFLNETNEEKAASKIAQVYEEKVREYGLENVCLLLPMRDGAAGVNNMNSVLQNKLNPCVDKTAEINYGKTTFREKDIVMHLKNCMDVSNGDVGIIKTISKDNEGRYLEASFYGQNTVRYQGEKFSELCLAYATTIHKSQGSQYKCVITSFMPKHKCMLARNLIYTSITRAEEEVVIVGDLDSISFGVQNNKIAERCTLLSGKIKFFEEREGTKALAARNPF